MVQAIILLLLGVGGSTLALVLGCAFISHALHNRSEKTCLLNTYFNWVMEKGNDDQKQVAFRLKHSRNLQDLKALVGYGMLVDR